MTEPIITEQELEYLFYEKNPKKNKTFFLRSLLYFALVLSLTGLVYLVINFRSIESNLAFWYRTEYHHDKSASNTSLNLGSIKSSDGNDLNFADLEENHLKIEVLNITAPINWRVTNNPADVAEGLSKGLIQIEGTSLPGEVGNVFVTGHSSNYPWAKGKYNSIFALLNKLVVGDTIQLKYKNTNYIYKVTKMRVVSPDDISVMKSENKSTLTLMTCTPVGTSLKRLIVSSDQIYPDPKNNSIIKTDAVEQSRVPVIH